MEGRREWEIRWTAYRYLRRLILCGTIRYVTSKTVRMSTLISRYLVIQVAKLSGFSPIITTVSPRNSDLVKALGATHTIDRNLSSDEIIATVKSITADPVKIVYDAISLPSTQNPAYDIVSPGGKLILVLNVEIDKAKLTPDKEIINPYGNVHAEGNRAFGSEMYSHLTNLFKSGDLKVRT